MEEATVCGGKSGGATKSFLMNREYRLGKKIEKARGKNFAADATFLLGLQYLTNYLQTIMICKYLDLLYSSNFQ